MSQSMVPHAGQRFGLLESPEIANEFQYKPVPMLAPVSMFLGMASAVALLGLLGIWFAFLGVILGFLALRQIRRSEGELGGKWLAATGSVLSLTFFLSGTTLHAYTYATEVPDGYRRISFADDIAKKPFVVEDGQMQIHPDVRSLAGQQVFFKGYMYPTRETENLTSFILVKDNGQCCFGGQPQLTDMVLVNMRDGLSGDYHTGLVSVAGVLRLRDMSEGGDLSPVYELEGTHFTVARTSF
jgi:hypothetical protein